jgi:DNA replication initiation complex subunit (GINS family)
LAREVDDKATRKALARIRRAKAAVERAIATSQDDDAAEAARSALTDWEEEFMSSIEERLGEYGSAFADPRLGEDGEALSRLQLAKLKEIEKKAKGKGGSGFKRGSSFKAKPKSGFGRKAPPRRSNTRDIHEDVIGEVEDAPAPDPVETLAKSGAIRRGFTPKLVEPEAETDTGETPSDDTAPTPDSTAKPLSEQAKPEPPKRGGFRVIEGGKIEK